MFTVLSLVTSVKDYVEIVHKLVETNNSNSIEFTSYYDLGAILTYIVLLGKDTITSFLTFKWLQNIAALPLIIPDIASAMISEISVLDGYFHNAFTFLETNVYYGNNNVLFYGLEKFTIGLINSIFLCLPTSTAHIITLRRFVMQGVEAGYLAGLGTLAGNVFWIGSLLFGFRFLVIPWLSLDILRYGLGFLLLMKYMWESYTERRTVLEDVSKRKIFLFNFLLAFTEQATIYPFLSNLSFGSDSTILESFPTNSFFEFNFVHLCYLGGLIIGSLSLLQLTCWFWENPAFKIYMWAVSSLKMTEPFSQRFVNICFLYLTMFFAISNVSYFGLDYTVTNPLGLIHEDRLVDQKTLLETSFLNTKASDRNTRRNRGRHGRRERWKRRVRRYRTFDASLYDQGIYDLFTIEDLNYGFDRFWLRRKIRNHRVRFRFFPGPWMRSFKKQLARPRLESFMGPRVEFFRILFEQAYHPEFHEFRNSTPSSKAKKDQKQATNDTSLSSFHQQNRDLVSFYSEQNQRAVVQNLLKEHSALRKFVRKFKTRSNTAKILFDLENNTSPTNNSSITVSKASTKPIHSKRWKMIFSKISHDLNNRYVSKGILNNSLNHFYDKTLSKPVLQKSSVKNYFLNLPVLESQKSEGFVDQNSKMSFSKRDRLILRYKSFLSATNNSSETRQSRKMDNKENTSKEWNSENFKSLTLMHPIDFYLQREQGFRKKMKFYGASIFRNFGVENNAPYYRIMMKKFFYYYKPTLRWERTMRTATMRKARRKGKRKPRKLNVNLKTQMLTTGLYSSQASTNPLNQDNFQTNFSETQQALKTKIQRPTHFYSLVSKRATRYRYQIYKDVLQHWYYTPFNRLLLKLDVDAFIRRQPGSHFLTKNEEKLLHLKRFLLSDYSNTIRWYSYMQHYDTMKTSIGKTKSFSNVSYNQQFFGTFKKIRHLFAITPSLTENNVLKFDQPLFNEFKNSEKDFNKNNSVYNFSVTHEELLADDGIYTDNILTKTFPNDLANQSTLVLKEYLKKATPIRKQYITALLQESNYSELTNFLLKGQKTRGQNAMTNENHLLNQEKNNLLNIEEKNLEKEILKNFFETKLFPQSVDNRNFKNSNLFSNDQSYLWFSLMKKSRNLLYNQEALKNYVSGRVEKREKQKKRQEKVFKGRLNNMKNWINLENTKSKEGKDFQLSGLRTSLQKAIKEGIFYQTSGAILGTKVEKSNLRNNLPKILNNMKILEASSIENPTKKPLSTETLKNAKNMSTNLKRHLNERVRVKALQTLNVEKVLTIKLAKLRKTIEYQPDSFFTNLSPSLLNKLIDRTLIPFNRLHRKVQGILESDRNQYVWKPMKNVLAFFAKDDYKKIESWKKREMVFSTRKKIRRKIYRVLDQKKQYQKLSNISDFSNLAKSENLTPLRQKQENSSLLESQSRFQVWNQYEAQKFGSSYSSKTASRAFLKSPSMFLDVFEKNFKKKRTRSRRYRRFKGRGPIKKHTLAEKLKRQFKLLKRYGEKQEGQDKKMEIFQMITKRKYNPDSFFETRELKQRRTRQSKHRYWKKHKRQHYLQVKRKQRKRRRSKISKLRVLNKEFKRLKASLEIKKWWWSSFFPSFKATTDAYWQVQKNQQIKKELSTLSVSEILQRDSLDPGKTTGFLQIGDKDFKPLMLPEALRLRNSLTDKGLLAFGTTFPEKTIETQYSSFLDSRSENLGDVKVDKKDFIPNNEPVKNEDNIAAKISSNLLDRLQPNSTELISNSYMETKKLLNTNPIPFYAGWDEGLRKFVVTNRLLSRKEAGYSMQSKEFNNSLQQSNKTEKFEFTKSPLQGMNAATTLYWQIPFTTYDPDQFFALGLDGFSPLAWRFFNFKHSKQTTQPLLVKNILYNTEKAVKGQSLFSYNLQLEIVKNSMSTKSNQWKTLFEKENNQNSKNRSRKIQKRQKRVKKHPRPPVWFPSGPLTNQVLPVHYIYVFYKRTRLPRDRYIGRRLRRSDDSKIDYLKSNLTKTVDITLRKRVKPIRKYHRKRTSIKNKENSLTVRRRPFKGFENDLQLSRPIFKTRSTTQMDILNSSLLKTKQRKKNFTNKQNLENLRIRQLRRRIQRQVLRPIWRYKPRSGGFIWPGDYLRLETVKAPTLKSTPSNMSQELNLQIRKKKRRNIQEWQIQPKKYLLQKHNLKVLKKRLSNAQNLNLYNQKSALLNL